MDNNPESLVLSVNAANFSGWTSIRINRSIENASGSFALGLTNLPEPRGKIPSWRGFEPCCIKLNGESIITGYLETIAESIDAHRHTIEISGRDRTADVIDSINDVGPADQVTLYELACLLLRPFDMTVTYPRLPYDPLAAGFITKRNFVPQFGDSTWAELERRARMESMLMTSNGQGGITINALDNLPTMPRVLSFPGAIISASRQVNNKDRFASVKVVNHRSNSLFAVSGLAVDWEVERYRQTLVVAESMGEYPDLQERARWEVKNRFAKAMRWEVSVAGWSQDGIIWQPSYLVSINAPIFGLNEKLLITAVEYTLSDKGGSQSNLTLCYPNAYDKAPLSDKNQVQL